MRTKSNSYSLFEILGKIYSALRYMMQFISNRNQKKKNVIDLKKIREYEGIQQSLENDYIEIEEKKKEKKKENVEKRLNNMF